MYAIVLSVGPYMHGFQGWPAWRTARQGFFTPRKCATPSSHYTTCGVRPAPTLPGPGLASTLVPFYSKATISSALRRKCLGVVLAQPVGQSCSKGCAHSQAAAAAAPSVKGACCRVHCSGKRTKSSCRLSQLAGIAARISSTPTSQQHWRFAWSRMCRQEALPPGSKAAMG